MNEDKLWGIKLTWYQKKLQEYIHKHRLSRESGYFNHCYIYLLDIYGTSTNVTINHLSKQECEAILRKLKMYFLHRTLYRTYMRGNKHVVIDQDFTTTCTCMTTKATALAGT